MTRGRTWSPRGRARTASNSQGEGAATRGRSRPGKTKELHADEDRRRVQGGMEADREKCKADIEKVAAEKDAVAHQKELDADRRREQAAEEGIHRHRVEGLV